MYLLLEMVVLHCHVSLLGGSEHFIPGCIPILQFMTTKKDDHHIDLQATSSKCLPNPKPQPGIYISQIHRKKVEHLGFYPPKPEFLGPRMRFPENFFVKKNVLKKKTGFLQQRGSDLHLEFSSYFLSWVFPKIGGKPPKWMVKIMENPIKMDDLGWKPTIFGNIQLARWWL